MILADCAFLHAEEMLNAHRNLQQRATQGARFYETTINVLIKMNRPIEFG